MKHIANAQCVLLEINDWRNINHIPRDLYDFYVLKCPYAKSDRSAASSSDSLDLSKNGWAGSSRLSQLMQWIMLKFCDEEGPQFEYLASDNVNETINDLKLNTDTPCVSHPRCVLQINKKVSVLESGKCRVSLNEAYITCLFRHIRNAFAHGNFAANQAGQVLLLDTGTNPDTAPKNKKYSFGMVTTLDFLAELKSLVENPPPDTLITKEMKAQLKGATYKVKIDKDTEIVSNSDDSR